MYYEVSGCCYGNCVWWCKFLWFIVYEYNRFKDDWVFDLGCFYYVCGRRDLFFIYEVCDRKSLILFNVEEVNFEGVGNFEIEFNNVWRRKLIGVRYVLRIERNLILFSVYYLGEGW